MRNALEALQDCENGDGKYPTCFGCKFFDQTGKGIGYCGYAPPTVIVGLDGDTMSVRPEVGADEFCAQWIGGDAIDDWTPEERKERHICMMQATIDDAIKMVGG